MRETCFYSRKIGGDGEIRTRESLHPTRFPSGRTRPLCDVSPYSVSIEYDKGTSDTKASTDSLYIHRSSMSVTR
jgi:hypothetical protein